MDVDVVLVPPDERGRMTGAALRADARRRRHRRAVRRRRQLRHDERRRRRRARRHRRRLRRARPVAAHRRRLRRRRAVRAVDRRRCARGFERADSFGIDPHKWLFAPYDCAALVYREPALASAAHAQHGTYLDMVSRDEWNPSDFAFHLSRRARGLPLWFSLATYGTDAYAEAVETTLDVARALRRRGRSARRVHAAARTAAVGRAVHRRRLGRRPLRGVEHGPGPGRRRPRRADVVARRELLPDLPRQPADDRRDAVVAPRRHGRLRPER